VVAFGQSRHGQNLVEGEVEVEVLEGEGEVLGGENEVGETGRGEWEAGALAEVSDVFGRPLYLRPIQKPVKNAAG
jgi:hypothetical protein